ncbi:hypothetical protein [Modestobacter sp. I12A-02662]|uniref:hypothetical protein n=1 Tax=Modestobacter sp. I12A-02662 TaxID=1730496 RepID=UPI0034DEA923
MVRSLREAIQRVAPLVVPHGPGVVSGLCSVVVVLARGRIVDSGPDGEVVTAPGSAPGRALVAAGPRLVLS